MKNLDLGIKVSTVGEDDRPDLEGKIVSILGVIGTTTGIVVGCNRSVGISIVDTDDHDNFMVCLRGAMMPNPSPDFDDLDEITDVIIEMIEAGVVDITELKRYQNIPIGRNSGGTSGKNCAYRQ